MVACNGQVDLETPGLRRSRFLRGENSPRYLPNAYRGPRSFLIPAPFTFTCQFEGSLPKDHGWRNAIQLQAAIPCTPRDPAVLPADNRTDPHHAALESADVKVQTPRRPAALHEANVSPSSATNRPQPNRKSPHRLLWDPAPTHTTYQCSAVLPWTVARPESLSTRRGRLAWDCGSVPRERETSRALLGKVQPARRAAVYRNGARKLMVPYRQQGVQARWPTLTVWSESNPPQWPQNRTSRVGWP
jgi:hypothetical protein